MTVESEPEPATKEEALVHYKERLKTMEPDELQVKLYAIASELAGERRFWTSATVQEAARRVLP